MRLDGDVCVAVQVDQDFRRALARQFLLLQRGVERVFGVVEIGDRADLAFDQPDLAVVRHARISDVVLREFDFGERLTVLQFHRGDVLRGLRERRVGAIERERVRRVVEAEQQLTAFDVIVFLDRDFDDLAGDFGGDDRFVGLHVRVVGVDVAARVQIRVARERAPPAAARRTAAAAA